MKSIDRRGFLKRSAVFGTVATTGSVLPVDGFADKKGRPDERQSLVPKLELGGTVSVSKPSLKPSQLSFRLGLARSRMSAYPCDSMDFVMIDLERPDNTNRQADWWGGDLSGRLLEFLCCSEGVDGKYDPRLRTLFERILAQRKSSGSIGRISDKQDPNHHVGCSKLFHGLMRYYELYEDPRALEAALGLAEELWSVKDRWETMIKGKKWFMDIFQWVVEPFARLYAVTNDPRWKDFCSMIKENFRSVEKREGFIRMVFSAHFGVSRSWR